jgi:tRNA A37 N6-isopentenylltransferase MiaA
VVVGGSFSYAKSLVKTIDTKAEEAKAAKAVNASEAVAV